MRQPVSHELASPRPQSGITIALAAPIAATLHSLVRAHWCAKDVGSSVWEFAISFCELAALGVTATDVRWLLARGLVEQALEVSTADGARRKFQPARNGMVVREACFVITDEGLRLSMSESFRPSSLLGDEGTDFSPTIPLVSTSTEGDHPSASFAGLRPRYDAQRRELVLGGRLVKRFRRCAPAQERILAAFEASAWNSWIADPLPERGDVLPQRRLSEAIRGLNRNQLRPLLVFSSDGTGRGVLWARR